MAFENDEEGLAIARRQYGLGFNLPRKKTVEVWGETGDNYTWSIQAFMSLMSEALAQVPPELMGSTTVELGGSYDDSSATLTISYQKDETAEEVAIRVERAVSYVNDQRRIERAAFERLREKYGDK